MHDTFTLFVSILIRIIFNTTQLFERNIFNTTQLFERNIFVT